MIYRDERETLRAENQALRAELQEASLELDRLRQMFRDSDGRTRKTVGHLEFERPRNGALWVLLALGIAGASAVFIQRQRVASRRGVHADPQVEPHEPPPQRGVPPQSGRPRIPVTPVDRTASVRGVLGTASVTAGEHCQIHVLPSGQGGPYPCRAEITCGTQTLYGGGYTLCEAQDGEPRLLFDPSIAEDDGDPNLTLDLVHDYAVIADGQGVITLALDPAANAPAHPKTAPSPAPTPSAPSTRPTPATTVSQDHLLD